MSRSLGGEEWDLEAQARNAGVSFEDYAVAMSPLMQMSLERSQARLQEIEAVISREEDPELSDEEVAKVRKWAAIVGAIASLSDADYDAVITIMTAVSAPNKRQHEILQELIRLKSSGKGPSRSAPEPGYH
jgi:histidine ammonia-lyase